MIFPKQTDIDKILEVIKKKTIKEIQAGYLSSLYFKDIYLYLAHNRLPSKKAAMRRVELLAEKYIMLDSLLFKLTTVLGKRNCNVGNSGNMCRQNNHLVSFKFICRTSRSYKNVSYN